MVDSQVVTTSGNVDVLASNTTTQESTAVGGALAGFFALGGSVSLVSVDNDILADVTNADIDAGNNLTVDADADYSIDFDAGGVAVALVGVGAAVAEVDLSSETTAQVGAGSTLNAGNNISVTSSAAATDFDVHTVVGSGGIVGLNASFTEIDSANHASAFLADGVDVFNANQVAVSANTQTTIDASSAGVNAGLVAVGAVITDVVETGSALAYVGNGVQMAQNSLDTVNDLTVTATNTTAVQAVTFAGAVGLGVVTGSDAKALSTASADAHIGNNADIDLANDLSVMSTVNGRVRTLGGGLSIGGLAVGISKATSTFNPTSRAYVGSSTDIDANNAMIKAMMTDTGSRAHATSSVGALIAGTGAKSVLNSSVDADAYVGTGSTIDGTGDITIRTHVDAGGTSLADGKAFGIATGGLDRAFATFVVSSLATVHTGANLDAAGDFTLDANTTIEGNAQGDYGSGGFIGGGKVITDLKVTNDTRATVNSSTGTPTLIEGSKVYITTSGWINCAVNMFDLTADSETRSAAGASFARADADVFINSVFRTYVGQGAQVIGGDTVVQSLVGEIQGFANAYAKSLGVIGGAKANANTTIVSLVDVNVQPNAYVSGTGTLVVQAKQKQTDIRGDAEARVVGVAGNARARMNGFVNALTTVNVLPNATLAGCRVLVSAMSDRNEVTDADASVTSPLAITSDKDNVFAIDNSIVKMDGKIVYGGHQVVKLLIEDNTTFTDIVVTGMEPFGFGVIAGTDLINNDVVVPDIIQDNGQVVISATNYDNTGILTGSGTIEVDKTLNLVEIVNKTDYDLVLNDIIFWDADTSAPPVTHISSNGHTYPLVYNPSGSPPLLDVDNGFDNGSTIEGGAGDVRFNGEIRNPGGTNDVLNQGGDIENCNESAPLQYACNAMPDISGPDVHF